MLRGLPILLGILLAACATVGTTAPPPTLTPTETAVATLAPASIVTPTTTNETAPTARPSEATPVPLVKGWPTVRRAGVRMTGRLLDEPPPFEGAWMPGPAVGLRIRITGLAPGEAVSLAGVGAYEFHALGCGVQPSPCTPGSGTTDPTVQLCGPIYLEAVEGTVKTTRKTTADADGTARATIRFVVPESERACPADPSFPWYVNSGEWRLRVTDRAHGLRLVGPPHLLIGP